MAESASNDAQPSSSGLDILVTEVAMDLMGVPRSAAKEAVDRVLDRLVGFFGVDDTFVRRHRPDRVSELVTIRPEREFNPNDSLAPEMLAEIPFDSDPVFQAQEHLKEPFVLYPEGSEAVQELVKTSIGVERSSFAIVPILREDQTVGILALVRFTDAQWQEDELRTLFAIATLIAQFWSRLDAEEKLAYQAHYDDMTGLPNRLRLVEEIATASEADQLSLLSLNIDNMKVINDGLDFELGDRFICGFADRLTGLVRDDTFVARSGGDQFCVLVPNTDPSNVEKVAARLIDGLRQSINLGDIKISRSVSIGIAHRPSDDVTHDLVAESEAAMHLAKKQGKNRFRVFDSEMRRELTKKFEQELELRRAIESREFILYYQPSVDLRSGTVKAVEALLRWNHPTDGLLTAGRFIETAEESGLVVEIGDFVLDAAIAQMSLWQHEYPELEMWINISPAQLMSRDLVTQVAMLLAEHDVNPSRICLEVTEHVVLDDIEAATGALDRLRAMGVRLALDDFGTGYSSMKQLKRLPVDCLKIDMSFVAGLGKSDHDAAIVDAAITLARAFGLGTVAEGVETIEQVDELLARGCGQAQGYLLAKPQSSEDIELILRAAPKPHGLRI